MSGKIALESGATSLFDMVKVALFFRAVFHLGKKAR